MTEICSMCGESWWLETFDEHNGSWLETCLECGNQRPMTDAELTEMLS